MTARRFEKRPGVYMCDQNYSTVYSNDSLTHLKVVSNLRRLDYLGMSNVIPNLRIFACYSCLCWIFCGCRGKANAAKRSPSTFARVIYGPRFLPAGYGICVPLKTVLSKDEK